LSVDKFRLGFFLFPPKFLSRSHACPIPPFCVHYSLVFIGKVLLGFQTSPSTFPFLFFSSFFCKFQFLIFFVLFFKTSNIKVDSIRKISDCKIDALTVERVPNTFENLNFSEMTSKMLKMMQIYQKCKFWGFHCFLVFFFIFF
jgi:hypothetical protein